MRSKLKKLKGRKKSSIERFNSAAEKVVDVLKVQITPSTEYVKPNDAFIKSLFRYSKETNKKKAVYSYLKINNLEGYEDNSPLDERNRNVLDVIIS